MTEVAKKENPKYTKQFKETVARLVKYTTRPTPLSYKIFNLQEGYPLAPMVDNEPLGPHNVVMTLSYLGERIPNELLETMDKPINLVLTNDHNKFVGQNTRDQLKTAKSRRRWYTVEDKRESININMNIRDSKLGGADQREMASFLSLLHLLRKANFHQVHSLVMANPQFKSPHFDVFKDPNKFEAWKKSEINVSFDFDENRTSAVDILTQKLKEKMPKTERKPLLFIGNDFSWRMTMFTLLLDEVKLASLEKLYGKDQETDASFGIRTKMTDLETIVKTMAKRNIPEDVKAFVRKYTLLTLLNKDYGKTDRATQLYEQIFNKENYSKLGYKRLLYGVRGPLDNGNDYEKSNMGEPIDYWDPKAFDQNLLIDESPYIKEMFDRLIEIDHPILSIPYLIGELPADLSAKLIDEELIDPELIAFIGKIGYIRRDSNREHDNGLKQGQIVIPYKTRIAGQDQDQATQYPIRYQVDERDKAFFNYVGVDELMTVAAVTVQEDGDYKAVSNPDGHLTVDMEQGSMAEKFSGSNTRIVAGFYISDVSDSKGAKKPGENARKSDISKPMNTVEGAISASFTTLFAIYQMSKLKKLSANIQDTLDKLKSLAGELGVS